MELDLDLKGTLIVAGEGINATLAGVACTIDALVAALQAGLPVPPLMTRLDLKRAQSWSVPFGAAEGEAQAKDRHPRGAGADQARRVGVYVAPEDGTPCWTSPMWC